MAAEEIARAIGDQEWLDSFATPLQEALRKAFGSAGAAGRGIKNFLHGSALGHPLHPALIELPLGAWTLAAILDAMELAGWGGHKGAADTAIKIEGDSIRCPWHGSRFCLKDGSVLDGPAVFPERPFDVRVRAGQIEVRARRQ
jgi:hypothetical protein